MKKVNKNSTYDFHDCSILLCVYLAAVYFMNDCGKQ